MSDDLAERYRAIRASTAKLMSLDLDNLSSWQSVRLDRATVLRLELDTLASKQLAGQAIDTNKYATASETLERLIGGRPEQPNNVAVSEDARNRLRQLITDVLLTPSEQLVDAMRREEMIMAQAAGVQPTPALTAPAEQTTSSSSNVKHDYIDAEVLNEPLPPAPPPAEPSHLCHASLNNSAAPPTPAAARPPQSQDWRLHLRPDGSINAPWFRPFG